MSRSTRLISNSLAGIIKQVITVVCGFILPRFILLSFGSSVNGLVSSISHYLGFISFLELGIGPVVQANLYKPLSDKNEEQVSKIVVSAERFFRKIALIFIVYIVALFFIFPRYINSDYDYLFTGSLILIISISTFLQYFFGATYQILLNAAQKSYIQLYLQCLTVVLNTIISIILIKQGVGIHVVKLSSALVFIIRPLYQAYYIHKHFSINKKVQITAEPIKQKWNGFAQHIAGAVCNGTDIMVLTIFGTLLDVSVYNVYYTIIIGITNTLITMATGIESLFGDMIAKGQKEELNKAFRKIEIITHYLVTIIFTITAITIVSFVKVYTRGVTDTNYETPLFAYALVLAYAIQAMRIPYARIINAAGRFKETQSGALISAGLNILVTIILVKIYGLIGTAIGTFSAMLFHVLYYVWYLKKHIICRSYWPFIKLILANAIAIIISTFICRYFTVEGINYLSWGLFAIKVSIVTIVVVSAVNGYLFRDIIKNLYNLRRIKKLR